MESGNHLSRDVSLLEDESQIRTGCGPANNAALSNRVSTLNKRSGKVATVLEALQPRQKGTAAHAAGLPLGTGSGSVGKGEACRRDSAAETESGPPCNSFRRARGAS